ncbi:MAG: hypothetical protein NC123_17300 [Butyrivibrio sp.]|nr:hypothetical protein [Butyrivibrio sp.]
MEKRISAEEASLKDILGGFMDSYSRREENVEFSDWLGDKLREEIPDLSDEAGEELAGDIIKSVTAYDKTLNELKAAVENGQSREGWFADRLLGNYADMSPDDTGRELLQIEENLALSNNQLMQRISEDQTEAVTEEGTAESPVEWNEYSVKSKAREIGEQVVLTGIAVAANVMKERVENEDSADISGAVRETLQYGLIKDSSETKAVVAGAVEVAVKKGIKNIVPEDIAEDDNIGLIGNMAGAAVEGAEAMFDLAAGKSTMTETTDRIGMAAVAAGGRMASGALKNWLISVPYVGPVLVDVAGGLLDHLHSPEFVQNAYKTIKDAAVSTWEGVKNSRTAGILRKAKNLLFA